MEELAKLWREPLHAMLRPSIEVDPVPCKKATIESKVYNCHSDELYTAISKASNHYGSRQNLAVHLFDKDLIDASTRNTVLDTLDIPDCEAGLIVMSVGKKVDSDPEHFHRFVQLLNSDDDPLSQKQYGEGDSDPHCLLRAIGKKLHDAYSDRSAASAAAVSNMPTSTPTTPQLQGKGQTAQSVFEDSHPESSQLLRKRKSASLEGEECNPPLNKRQKLVVSKGRPPESSSRASTAAAVLDLSTVTEYLLKLDKSQVYHLGISLGLSLERVKSKFESAQDTMTFLDEIINAWLQRVDQVDDKGGPSWKTLVAALRSGRLNLTSIASNIEKNHVL